VGRRFESYCRSHLNQRLSTKLISTSGLDTHFSPQSIADFWADALGEWIAMLHARGDESYGGSPRTTRIYVVAGYVASVSRWWEFDRRWRKTMRELGIAEPGKDK
jgi:hypothetical protein